MAATEAMEKTIVTEAMKAYASWCEVQPRESESLTTPFRSMIQMYLEDLSDFCTTTQWVETYTLNMRKEGKRWWALKSEDEIKKVLNILPLNEVSQKELFGLVHAIILEDRVRSAVQSASSSSSAAQPALSSSSAAQPASSSS